MMGHARNISVNLVNKYTPWNKAVVENAYSLWMRGYAFIDEQYYSGEALVRYVSDCLHEVSTEDRISVLKDLIPNLNGCWALVYETDGVVLAAVDRLRSIPLFYAMENGKVFLSDDARQILKCLNNAELDDICAAEFLVTGYVTGKDTLYKGLYQIQAGEILEIGISRDASPNISIHRYYRFIFGDYFEADERELEEELSKLWHRIFSRYAIALKGKTPVIPLSGGLDSRLIVAMLKRCGVENVICFSYGRDGNAEVEASRAVAKALGYKWLFCPYDYPSWYKWFREEALLGYIEYTSNKSSVFHIQDWPAVRGVLNDDFDGEAVFMPGHGADFLSGEDNVSTRLFEADENTKYNRLAIESILSYRYLLWPWRSAYPNLTDIFVERIKQALPAFSEKDKSEAIRANEAWSLENLHAKYYINSVRTYEFFGCQWMLPWWDYELMDFFLRVKFDSRHQKRLYRTTLVHKIFVDELNELARIPVVGKLSLSGSVVQKAENHPLRNYIYQGLRRTVPSFVKGFYHFIYTYRNTCRKDFIARYGRWGSVEKEEKACFRLSFRKLEDALSIPAHELPKSVERILKPYMNKSILARSTNGLNSAYYLTLLTSTKRSPLKD